MHGGEVGGGLRERDDVAAGGARSVAVLDLRDRAEDLEDLLRLRAQRLTAGSFGEHLGVDGGVLTHLEFGEVEAERLHLPQQLLEVSVRLAWGTRIDEGLLHGAQIGQQRVGVAIREIGVALACGGDPAGDQQHRALVRLDVGALGGIRGTVLVGVRQTLQQAEQLRGGRGRVLGQRERLGDPHGGALQAQQDVLRTDRRGLLRDGGGHERVAVAVAAHPRAEADEGTDDGCPAAGSGSLQRIVDAPVDVRDGRVESLVEDCHDGTHLVDRRRLLRPQRRRAPERVDLLQHAPLRTPLVRAAVERGIALGEQSHQTSDAGGHRATARLGGMSREHGVKAHRLQTGEGGVVADLRRQAHEGRGHRVGRVLSLRAPVALAQDTHTLVFFGEVDEMEVDRERTGDLVGALHGEGLGDLRRPLEGLR